MRKSTLLGMALAASVGLGGCTTNDRYAENRQLERAATGAAIGAAAGAGVGALVDGVSPVEGAVAGAVAGGAIGALTSKRDWRRDGRGYCYYFNSRGERIYDYSRRC